MTDRRGDPPPLPIAIPAAVWKQPHGLGVLTPCPFCQTLHAHRIGPDGDLAAVRRSPCGRGRYLLGGPA
jgi:hypothetical protein